MNTKRSLTGKLLFISILLFATTSQLFAQSLQRLAARFQGIGEVATVAPPLPGGAGGTVVFSPMIKSLGT
jgi:hypothetical protein